jgi:hypothetical protein
MKKYLGFILAMSVVTGCSFDTQTEEDLKAADKTEETGYQKDPDVYVPNPQVTDDSTLTGAGDSITDRKGELILKTMKEVNQTLTVGGLQYTIKDIKLLHYTPDYSLIDFYHPYTHDEEFNFVKLSVEVKNDTKAKYHFAPIAMMKINDTILKTWEDDFYLEDLNGEIAPGQTKRGNIGFIVGELNTINKVEMISGDLLGEDEKKAAQPVKLTVPFD